ncbi:hypothetical protein DBA29_20415 [Xenophilus aerolatus]|nr:hypothetical protein [Xenophilus aerolatus]
MPQRFVLPPYVTFVSVELQFVPVTARLLPTREPAFMSWTVLSLTLPVEPPVYFFSTTTVMPLMVAFDGMLKPYPDVLRYGMLAAVVLTVCVV